MPVNSNLWFPMAESLAQILWRVTGSVGFLAGTVLLYRRTRAVTSTARTTRDQHSAEQFREAIRQIDNQNNISEIIAGIYTLQRVAQTTPSYHQDVMLILSAYVRSVARGLGKPDEPKEELRVILEVFLGRPEYVRKQDKRWRLAHEGSHFLSLGPIDLRMYGLEDRKELLEPFWVEGLCASLSNSEASKASDVIVPKPIDKETLIGPT